MHKRTAIFLISTIALTSCARAQVPVWSPLLPAERELDSLLFIDLTKPPLPSYTESIMRLTDDDYREVAEELGVEIAAIKAIVDIETGRKHEGFYAPGKPIINFDLSMYRPAARRHGVDLAAAQRRSPEIFRSPDIKRYGSQQKAQQARLDAARAIHEASALEGTFWGMFQIGGFNWKICGTESVVEFAELMSRSERDQLQLFANFCKARNLVKYIQNKDWAGFSLRYNGPGYASKGYHTKIAAAYAKFKK